MERSGPKACSRQVGRGREAALAQQIEAEAPRYLRAFAEGDPDNTAVWFGEAAGLIGAVEPAAALIERMMTEAIEIHSTARE